MPPVGFFLLPLAVLAIIVLAFFVNRRRDQTRKESLRRFALGRGFEFRDAEPSLAFHTHLFQKGGGKRLSNVLLRDGMEERTLLFDYR